MGKPVVFVIGATGYIGTATLHALSTKYKDQVDIRAGVRSPDKAADKLKGIAGVSIVQAEMGANDKLVQTLAGVNALYIVTPAVENRAELTIATAEAAKKAGVKQLKEVEDKISKLGVPYTFFRLPLFVDNYWAFKDPIVGQSSIYSPVDPTKPYTPVVVEDAGKAAAAILVNPAQHANKTYKIISDRHSYNDVAAAFSEALGKEVKYVQVPYDTAKQSFLKAGFPDGQVDEILELYRLIDSGSPVTNEADVGDYTGLTGENPTNLKAWVTKVAGAFK